jgi:ribosomal protein S6
MNNNYEATLALNTQGNDESVDEILRGIETTFRKNGAEVAEIRKLEKRKLAYEPQKKRINEAYFVAVQFGADSAKIKGLRGALKLDDNILLTYIAKLDSAA